MKKLTTLLLFLFAFTANIPYSSAQETITSRTILYGRTAIALSDPGVKWVNYGQDSKQAKFLVEGSIFSVTKLGQQDLLMQEKETTTEDYGSLTIAVNLLFRNESQNRPASDQEIVTLLNEQENTGFIWDDKLQVNRLLQTYLILSKQIFKVTPKPSSEALTQFLSTQDEKASVIGIDSLDVQISYAIGNEYLYIACNNNTPDHWEIGLPTDKDGGYTATLVPVENTYIFKVKPEELQSISVRFSQEGKIVLLDIEEKL
ncbi:MAG: hypothetical protein H6765_06495 [Candidatus Peribacteria bacterium]|nr:MAG: hypothetical protein H6765_06495 [Candidatus Peribacteria bacterium]